MEAEGAKEDKPCWATSGVAYDCVVGVEHNARCLSNTSCERSERVSASLCNRLSNALSNTLSNTAAFFFPVELTRR